MLNAVESDLKCNLVSPVAFLPAVMRSALPAAAAKIAAVASTSKAACYSLAEMSTKVQGRRGSTEGAGSRRCYLWQLMLYLM